MKNYYDILGVSSNSTDKDILRAYRKLAREYHPDLNRGDEVAEEKFKQINEAYEVICDPVKRSKYDKYGDKWAQADQFRHSTAGTSGPVQSKSHWGFSGDSSGDSVGFDFGSTGGIFDRFFSRFGHQQPNDASHKLDIDISMKEAFNGTNRRIQINNGRTIEVTIPRGVDTGSKVKISNGGGGGRDLILDVTVSVDSNYQRDGDDIYTQLDVPIDVAMLGGEIPVTIFTGRSVALKIPPETQNGQKIRLAGKGMPVLGNSQSYGDLYIVVSVSLPDSLTEREKELFMELRRIRKSRR